jgi:hypothetical protein
VKNWEIIADNVKKAGWNLGWVSAVDSRGRTIFVADAASTESGENNLRVLSGYKQKFREHQADIIPIRPHDALDNLCAVKAKRRLPSNARRSLKLTQFGCTQDHL